MSILGHSAFGKLLLVIACIAGFYLASKLLTKVIRELGQSRASGELRVRYTSRVMNIGLTFCCVVVVCFLLGLGYSEVSVFLSSIFAVVGVALFAQWSILSNVTASMIIFFAFPYKVGDYIKILDKDDDMSGAIDDIRMFHVLIRRPDGELITYPNSLLLQKAVLVIEKPLPNALLPSDEPSNE